MFSNHDRWEIQLRCSGQWLPVLTLATRVQTDESTDYTYQVLTIFYVGPDNFVERTELCFDDDDDVVLMRRVEPSRLPGVPLDMGNALSAQPPAEVFSR